MNIPLETVVIESGDKTHLSNSYLRNLKANTRYILKTDAYIDSTNRVPKNVEFVLDGGNLYRDKNVKDVPKKIICINGSFIDDELLPKPEKDKGLSFTHIVSARENTSVKNFLDQTIDKTQNICAKYSEKSHAEPQRAQRKY